ncbi:unnamed protein product [Anisakis simplex]|uniref:BTB domain-containing protein n=1 Tax=Anisakis simplex TaxID=6269 RepID=A0A0M3K1D4_ANISI|nr:unnamed protein product [Anisakis simplex]
MSDIKRWTLLSLLSTEFIDSLQSAIVFGSSGSEAILITKEDEVFAIGTNSCSCLGTNRSQATLEPSRIDTLSGRGVVSLAFGSGPHVLALCQNGEVFSWGHNAFGQLGIGSTTVGIVPNLVGDALSGHNVIQIACGSHHSVAVTDRGEVFSWGRNSCGQVGIGSNVNQDLPRQVTGQLCRTQSNKMFPSCLIEGVHLLLAQSKLMPQILANRFVRSVVCGQNNTLALTDDGEVFGWGFNGNGQLGAGNLSNQHSPARVIGLQNVVIEQIACGFAHSLALSDEGQLFAWGSNTCGQLCASMARTNQTSPVVVASTLGRVAEIAAIHACNITAAVNQSGKVYMWGQVRGQTATCPIQTQFGCIDDVFACFASPAVACRPIQFDICRRSTILDAIRVAFDDPTTGDVKISVDGHLIHAHKALLRLRCDYFRSRFREYWQDDSECAVVEVPHYSYAVYRSFIRWLYTDELHIDIEDAVGLLDLANCYCENELKQRCTEFIKKGISIENAATFYASALRFEVKDLEEFCFQL